MWGLPLQQMTRAREQLSNWQQPPERSRCSMRVDVFRACALDKMVRGGLRARRLCVCVSHTPPVQRRRGPRGRWEPRPARAAAPSRPRLPLASRRAPRSRSPHSRVVLRQNHLARRVANAPVKNAPVKCGAGRRVGRRLPWRTCRRRARRRPRVQRRARQRPQHCEDCHLPARRRAAAPSGAAAAAAPRYAASGPSLSAPLPAPLPAFPRVRWCRRPTRCRWRARAPAATGSVSCSPRAPLRAAPERTTAPVLLRVLLQLLLPLPLPLLLLLLLLLLPLPLPLLLPGDYALASRPLQLPRGPGRELPHPARPIGPRGAGPASSARPLAPTAASGRAPPCGTPPPPAASRPPRSHPSPARARRQRSAEPLLQPCHGGRRGHRGHRQPTPRPGQRVPRGGARPGAQREPSAWTTNDDCIQASGARSPWCA